MWELRDLQNLVVGRLTVLRLFDIKKWRTRTGMHSAAWWTVRCECGVEKEIRGGSLTKRKLPTRSCGCLRVDSGRETSTGKFGKDCHSFGHSCPTQTEDIKGKHFGRWFVLDRAKNRTYGTQEKVYWICSCKCGVQREVMGTKLRNGRSTGCCYACAHVRDSRGRMRKAA
jgi:hypothetical protein